MSCFRPAQSLAPALVLAGMLVPVDAIAQTGFADTATARQRIDRTVVSPFETTRRIVIGPADDGGKAVVFEPPAARASVPVPMPAAALTVETATGFVSIGPLDQAPQSSLSASTYEDIGPYPGLVIPVEPTSYSASSF